MATRWSEEQLSAINLEGNNIIVSAGAGSGKTAVLTERVLRKIKSGIHIDELLILTFTNAAAKEMKDRIRSKLRKENLNNEVNLIDNAYITTFDSFSLSIVKKYHTYLNISRDIGITDISILNIKKQELIDSIFDKYYKSNDLLFSNLINNFCFKDDKELKKLIIKLNDKLDMRYDKEEYLKNYIDKYYSEQYITSLIDEYFLNIKNIIDEEKKTLKELSLYMDGTYIEKVEDYLLKLFKATSYDDVVMSLDGRFPSLPKNTEEEAKKIKDQITSMIKEIKSLIIYNDSEEIKKELLSTKDNTLMIVKIVLELDKLFREYKLNNNMFDFSDISRMAIKVVEENSSIRNELSEKFQEIMVDEYQDTNDIQEYFISLISHNNVYMVGDIKQSIYRFRNANPYIFKNKYDLYSNSDKGIKIDLLKNFRSREEVLNNINLVFDNLMDDKIGGASYKESHRMVFGNKTYNEEGHTNQEYDFSILTYLKQKEFTNNEQEMFIIGKDILDKVNSKYQVFDKDEKLLRDINYSDFVILIDRTSDFDNYKKVFEYLHIPLTLYKDEDLVSDTDIYIIKNIFSLIRCIDREDYKEEFKYLFMSIGRSYLFNINDNDLFNYFVNDSFMESDIYKKLCELYNYYYELSPKAFFIKMCDIFNYEEKLLTVSNIEVGRVRLEYFYNLLNSFEENGKDIEDFIEYLDTVIEEEGKVSFSLNNSSSNSVKIMTIHKSKGLEFPICYFSGFSKEFSFRELNDNILYSNKFGIITPYFNEYIKPTITKTLLKLDNKKEEISEKIRLLYVAVTRAKEKMIIVMPKIEDDNLILNTSYSKGKMKSFLDMMKLIYNDISDYINVVEVDCTKDYLINQSNNDYHEFISNDTINISLLNFDREIEIEEKFSKGGNKLITKEEQIKMDYGTKVHEVLEMIDFNNPDYFNLDDFVKEKVSKFINSDIIQNNINSKFYKEYEFIYNEDLVEKHGIIDLMIENDKEIIIIDYKLKNTNDILYNKQLNGYKDIISKRCSKPISIYLYSIIDGLFNKI